MKLIIESRARGLTVVEVLVVLTVLALLAILLVPALPSTGHGKTGRAPCVSNLRQVGLGFKAFAIDNDEKYPWDLPTVKGGTGNPSATNCYWNYSQVSKYIENPKVLICPSDKSAKRASTWAKFAQPEFQNHSLSYFVGLDADSKRPETILSGDRNIGGTSASYCDRVKLEVQTMASTNSLLRYTNALHGAIGIMLMADGSVQAVSSAGLPRLVSEIQQDGDKTGGIHLVFPK